MTVVVVAVAVVVVVWGSVRLEQRHVPPLRVRTYFVGGCLQTPLMGSAKLYYYKARMDLDAVRAGLPTEQRNAPWLITEFGDSCNQVRPPLGMVF